MAADAADVLGWAGAAARQALGDGVALLEGEDLLQPDGVLPVVTEVVDVVQTIAFAGHHLVQAHVILQDALLALIQVELVEERLQVQVASARAHLEVMQMGIGPAHGDLDDLVDLRQRQVAGQP